VPSVVRRHTPGRYLRGRLRTSALIGWHVKLPPLFLAQVRLVAAEQDISCASLVRRAIAQWLAAQGYRPVPPAGATSALLQVHSDKSDVLHRRLVHDNAGKHTGQDDSHRGKKP
jgi:hypothetical protein